MKLKDFPQINKMNKQEKILFVEELWDSISSEIDNTKVPASHQKTLDQRLAQHTKTPGRLLTLEELQMNINSRK